MQLPKALIKSLQSIKGFNPQTFEAVHDAATQVTSVRFNPSRFNGPEVYPFQSLISEPVPWSSYGYYLSKRPSFTFDPFFHAGCYYVQDASSMFLEQALIQTTDLSQPLKVLDLCAAPGGKSTHLQSLLSPQSLLVSNEVIKNRAGILKQNIYKWGSDNVVVTNNDPQHFKKLEGFFDVMVVDAPCSGSGLFRKDEEALGEWSPENVQLCCGRQKRIIADALDALKEDGLLIYSTCSYSSEENEDIADWLVEEKKLENISLKIEEAWGIIETLSSRTQSRGYRFFPDHVKGEGFYLAAFRKTSASKPPRYKMSKLEKASAKEQAVIQPWLINKDLILLKEFFVYALPPELVDDYSIIKNALNVQYAGVAIGEVMKEKLIPDHALALSNIKSPAIKCSDVSYEEAIVYLQKGDLHLQPAHKGWQLISYQHHNLGWINALQNRINNYYPKELRILKQFNDSAFEK